MEACFPWFKALIFKASLASQFIDIARRVFPELRSLPRNMPRILEKGNPIVLPSLGGGDDNLKVRSTSHRAEPVEKPSSSDDQRASSGLRWCKILQ